MTDQTDKGSAKPTPTKGAAHKANDIEGNRNTDVEAARLANIGLDTQGQFRLGDKYTLHVEGGNVAIRQSHSGLVASVTPSELEGLLEERFFKS